MTDDTYLTRAHALLTEKLGLSCRRKTMPDGDHAYACRDIAAALREVAGEEETRWAVSVGTVQQEKLAAVAERDAARAELAEAVERRGALRFALSKAHEDLDAAATLLRDVQHGYDISRSLDLAITRWLGEYDARHGADGTTPGTEETDASKG